MIAAVLALASPAPATAPAEPPKRYISAFCAPLVLSDGDPASIRQRYAEWDVKLAPDDVADSYRVQDADAPGQMAEMPGLTGLHIFVERRRGGCSLVYDGARIPPAALADLAGPINDGRRTLHWRERVVKRVGPPGPIRYVLPVSEDGHYGACATIFEDLRLRSGAPATLVRVETCRLGDDETTTDHG